MHGCQIVVQSKQEHVLKKQIRKEMKLARKEKDLLVMQSFTTDLVLDVLLKIREQELQKSYPHETTFDWSRTSLFHQSK